MKNKLTKFTAAFILIVLLGWTATDTLGKAAQGKVLYRVGLVSDQAKTIIVKQNGKNLELSFEGFNQPIVLKANGGGVETCRTTLQHKSDKATITLSLPIPTPNMPCQMTAGYISINSQTYKISLQEEEVKKTSGRDDQLRKIVGKLFGNTSGE